MHIPNPLDQALGVLDAQISLTSTTNSNVSGTRSKSETPNRNISQATWRKLSTVRAARAVFSGHSSRK